MGLTATERGFKGALAMGRGMARAGSVLSRDAFTVNQRILLHLRESGTNRESGDAYALAQPGIAEALGIRVNHVSRAVKQLIGERLVVEATTRIRGQVRKRKVYTVTPEGHALAQRLATEISHWLVTTIDGSGEKALAANDARRLVTPPTLTRLLGAVGADGRLDLRHPAAGPTREPPRYEEGRPEPRALVGRDDEVAACRGWIEAGPPVLAVIGPRGIGKTALLSASIDGGRPLFWWTFRENDAPSSVLAALSSWLGRLGKGGLGTWLAKGAPGWREVSRTLARDLRGTHALLVLDDAQSAGPDLGPYVDGLVEAAAASGCSVAVTTEVPLPRRTALLADGLLREIRLKGLDRESARHLMPRETPAREFEKAYRLTLGNPLSLRLISKEETPGDFTPEERALVRVLRMRQDEG